MRGFSLKRVSMEKGCFGGMLRKNEGPRMNDDEKVCYYALISLVGVKFDKTRPGHMAMLDDLWNTLVLPCCDGQVKTPVGTPRTPRDPSVSQSTGFLGATFAALTRVAFRAKILVTKRKVAFRAKNSRPCEKESVNFQRIAKKNVSLIYSIIKYHHRFLQNRIVVSFRTKCYPVKSREVENVKRPLYPIKSGSRWDSSRKTPSRIFGAAACWPPCV